MPERVTTKSITRKQDEIDCQHDGADANSKPVRKPQRFPDIVRQNQQKEEREVEKVAMNVLHDQWERTLAPIAFSRLAHCACWRIRPKCLVIGAAIIIAGQPKSTRRPKNQQRGGED